MGQVILRQHHRCGAEGVGLQDVGASVQETLVDVGDHVGAGEDQVLVTPLVLRAAEVLRPQVAVLDGGAHGPVQDQDALSEQRF